MTSTVRHHIDTMRQVVIAVPGMVWFIPFCVFWLLYGITVSPLAWTMSKQIQEIVAPTIIGVTALAALATHYWVRHFFTLLVVLFVWSLFLRELHLEFTEWGIYVALIGLCWWGSARRENLISFGITRPMMIFFMAALLTYILTDIVDRKAFRSLEFLLGPESSWQHLIEETGESLAHLFAFGFVLCTLWRGAMLNAQNTTSAINHLPTK